MSDIESRLRAAMQASVEHAPPGLLGRVRQRHRRHVRRMTAGWLAGLVVVAAASPSAVQALHGHRTEPPRRDASHRHGREQHVPMAAPGTVLSSCAMANPGAVGSTWRAGLRAGPLYFTPKDAAVGERSAGAPGGRPQLYAVIVVVAGLKPGSTVVLRAAPGSVSSIRFLYGPDDTMNAGTKYTMHSGETGVTFVACPPETGAVLYQKVTDYYGGFLVRDNRCVPLDVWVDGRGRPFRVSVGSCL